MTIDYIMLASDSLTAGLSLYLAIQLFRAIGALSKNIHLYEFGSPLWWHWIEHVIIALVSFIGAGGLGLTQVLHTINQASTSIDINPFEVWNNMFLSIILIACIMTTNHALAEEIPHSKFRGEHRKASNSDCSMHRRSTDSYNNREEQL